MSDVFKKDPTEGENTSDSAFEALVGEGKKFADQELLAKGKLEADSYIEQLQEEGKVMREKLAELEGNKDKESTVAELLKAVREHQKEQGTEGENNQVTDEDLSERIKAIMKGETEAETAAKNRSKANKAVLDKLDGDVEAAQTYVAERAKTLGMTTKQLGELSERSPTAFTKLMEIDASTVSDKGITQLPNHDTSGGGGGQILEVDGHKTKAYYDQLKKEIGPAKYWNDVKIQGQYAKDAMALKERFNQ